MSHALAPYWVPNHMRPSELGVVEGGVVKDPGFFRLLKPPVMEIMDGGTTAYQWVAKNLPDSIIIARSWGLDDMEHTQQRAMLADPVGTAKRHAKEWNEKQKQLGFDKRKTYVKGVNEPWVWEPNGVAATVKYEVAFLDELWAVYGMHGAALRLSVGWPGNSDTETVKDTPPNWDAFAPVRDAILRGGHILCLHEYWPRSGPQQSWGWLAGRALKCPWDVKIVIGECGMSYAVERSGVPTPEQGWQAHITDETYAKQLVEYHNRMVADPRIIGLCVYLCDYAAKEWRTKDLEPAYDNVLNHKGELKARSTKPFEPVEPVGAKTTVRVNIRKGAGTSHAIVRTVNAGTLVKPVGKNATGDWYKLDDGNWIYAAYVAGAPANLPVDGVVTPPTPVGRMRWPLDVVRVTQIYGVNEAAYRKFGLAGHNGIDLGCDTGTPIKAMAGGEVVLATNDPEGYGLVIRIWHPQLRCYTLYAHNSLLQVKVGDKVTIGQVIALSGNTGNSTGPHAHIEVRLADQVGKYAGGNPGMGASTVDPMGFVEGVIRG